jgi:hypothetical protein
MTPRERLEEGKGFVPGQGAPRRRAWPWLVGVTIALVLGAALVWWTGLPAPPASPSASSVAAVAARARRETRPTLDPALFVGRARRAHEVARAIPDALDQLYCYCGCDKLSGHKSLLSCYTDGHAPT